MEAPTIGPEDTCCLYASSFPPIWLIAGAKAAPSFFAPPPASLSRNSSGALLQIFLRLLPLRLEHLGAGGRAFMSFLEVVARVVRKRHREADRSDGEVDRLDPQHLTFL